ncbi:hypothetical protein HMPREF0693_1462 [Proteus mirabilis ATCC 29906]|nr:hypothetical protein HMPREF0693_1462 [Proteus mirabilis ATCC 29906]KXB99371.1 hypothetical protein HMPREF3203_02942 [Proteus mirabilis]PVF83878.1 hypothetical protein CSC14_3321 [Proteus mirabilis]
MIVRFIFSQDAFFSTITDTAINQNNPLLLLRQTKNNLFEIFLQVKSLMPLRN